MALDEKGRMLHGRLEFFERNVVKLIKHMTTIVGHHAEGVEQGMRFSDRVKNVASQEPFAELQDRLVAISEIQERIALERKNIMCNRAETQVLEKLAEVRDRVITPVKALLQDRDASVRALVKAEQKHADQGQKSHAAPVSLVELRHQLRNTEKVVDNNMELFEAQRIDDLKDILEEFLRCEMYYHCRALEVLAPALAHLAGVNGEMARESMREEINGLNRQLKYT